MNGSSPDPAFSELPLEIREMLGGHLRFREETLATLSHFLRFDRKSYELIVIPNIPGAPPYDQVIRWPEVEHLTLHRGFSRVSEKQNPPFPNFHRTSSEHFKTRGNIPLHLFHEYQVDHSSALALAFKTIRENLTQHELDSAREILDITRADQTLLPREQQQELDRLARMIDTARHFSPDYRSTRRYLNRVSIETEIIEFLEGPNHAKWIAEMTAKGGTGKTMLIRWFISRHCVPRGIPCSRIDFDDVDLSVPVRPWQLLSRFIRELEFQLPSTLTTLAQNLKDLELQDARGSEAEARANDLVSRAPQLIAEGLSHVGQERLILILETTEEALLSQRSDLHQFLASFIELHELVPGLRILIAGRYPMEKFDQGPDFQRQISPVLRPLKLDFFSDLESGEYLDQRKGTIPLDMREAMIGKAGGIPIKLAMLADLVTSDPQMTAADIRDTERIDLVYLIKRIVARIPSAGVRWLLRYGTIPRSLTREFAIKVVSPFLQNGLNGRLESDNPADDQKGIPDHIREPDLYPALSQDQDEERDPEKLWERLCDYSSGSSWVEQKEDRLVFHSEVIDPMRRSLAGKPVFLELHEAAATWFLKQIEADPANHLSHRSNALFHLIHVDPSRGRKFWKDQVVMLEDRDERAIFCTDLFSKDYLDSEGRIREDLPGTPFFDSHFLAQVYLEAAWASYDEISLENQDSEAMTFFRKGKDLAGDHYPQLQNERTEVFEAALAANPERQSEALRAISFKSAGHESDVLAALGVQIRMPRSPGQSIWDELRSVRLKIKDLTENGGEFGRSKSGIQQSNRLAKTLYEQGQVKIAEQLLRGQMDSYNPIQIRMLIETGQYHQALTLLEPHLEDDPEALAFNFYSYEALAYKFECHYRRGEWLECQKIPLPGIPLATHFALACGLPDKASQSISSQFEGLLGNPNEYRYFDCLLVHHQLRYHFTPENLPARFELSGEIGDQLDSLVSVLSFQISERIVLENEDLASLGSALNLPVRGQGHLEQFERFRDVILTEESPMSRVPLWIEFAFVVAPPNRDKLWSTLALDLEMIDHPVARAHLLTRLRDLASNDDGHSAISEKILSLFPSSLDDPLLAKLNPIDFGSYLFTVAEAHRVFGNPSDALPHLEQAFQLVDGPRKPWLWRELQLAHDRIEPSLKPPSLDEVNEIAETLVTFPQLALLTSLEQGERLIRQKNIAGVLKMTTSIKDRMRGDQIPDLTRARFYSLLAAVSLQRGKTLEYEEAFEQARRLCLGLGFDFKSSESVAARESPTDSDSQFAEPTLAITIRAREESYSVRHHHLGKQTERFEEAPRFFQPNAPFQNLLRHLVEPDTLSKALEQTLAWLIGNPSVPGFQDSQFLRLENLPPDLQPYPWELLQVFNELSAHQIYRSGTIHKYKSVHLRESAALANHFGPDRFDLTDYRLSSNLTKIEHILEENVPVSEIQTSPRIAMFEAPREDQYDRQIGHANWKVRLREFAREGDLVPNEIENLSEILSNETELPELIYLSFSFTATRATPRLAVRRSLTRKIDRKSHSLLGPAEFVEHFKGWSKYARFPGIVIDVPYISFPHEAAAQLAMRNQFAAELFHLAPFPFILATGFWEPDSLHQKVENLLVRFRARQPIGQIHQSLVGETDESYDWKSVIDHKASVLFTHDPKLHTIPAP